MMCGNGLHNGVARGWVLAFADLSPRPPRIMRDPEPQSVRPGGVVTLTVQATGAPPLSYQWQRNGTDVQDNEDYSGATTAALVAANARLDLEGAYRCRVTNTLGEVWSLPALLSVVSVGPDFDRDGDVDAHDFGHLQACLTGTAVPQGDPACADARLDADSDVDQTDLDIFWECMKGPGVAVDPNCPN
jgi:hypothetical protein